MRRSSTFFILRFGEPVHYGVDLFVYLFFVPVGGWLLLTLLENSESEIQQLSQDNDLNIQFSQDLGNARSWSELIQRIVEYSHQVAPDALATLFVYDPHSMRMLPEAASGRSGSITFHPAQSISPDTLPLGSLPQLLRQTGSAVPNIRPAVLGSPYEPPSPPLPPHRYDLPVSHNDQQIGVLKLKFPVGSTPSKSQIRALKNASAVMALALEGSQLQTLAAEQEPPPANHSARRLPKTFTTPWRKISATCA